MKNPIREKQKQKKTIRNQRQNRVITTSSSLLGATIKELINSFSSFAF
jgi:hypothetical protein